MDALTLLSGDARTFRQEVWASRVHLHRREPDSLVWLLSLEAVDRLLTGFALRTPAVRLVQDGSVLPASAYTRRASTAGEPLTGLLDVGKVLERYRGGATVVLQGLQRFWPPLTALVRDLELALGHPCQANAYLTPPGAQGFARHSDTHDVFVVQTHGSKRWTIDDEDVVLEPGMVAYLPTGTPHSARTQEGSSLHVTIGINRLTWRALLGRIVTEALGSGEYDAPLPAGYLDDPSLLSRALAGRLETLARVIGTTEPDTAAEQSIDRFLTSRQTLVDGGLLDTETQLDDGTLLERRAGSVCVLRPGPDRLKVLLGDRELRLPSHLLPALELVRDHVSWKVGELPLDEQSRLVLARRLLREGLVRVAR
ncbi:MAG TPA: cupin domain-containing protein [Nocardioidaceae bacterium]|nr:cupin domain-containing protein [Nocardioidaceae bacterium]